MTRLNVDDARCKVLFASGLQRSDAPTTDMVAEVIRRTLQRFGIRGCTSRMAQEFGDHPEAAVDRMRWVRQLVGQVSASPAPRQAAHGGPPSSRPPTCAAQAANGSARRAA